MSCILRNNRYGPFLADMLTSARFEVLPAKSVEDKILEHLPPGRSLTVTASPAKGIEETLVLTERLARQGYAAVPHLAARMISGRAELVDICARMQEAGVRTVFVPGGDQDPPAGSYSAALDHATHVVSNLSFDPATIKHWLDRVRARGVMMPMLLGIPGPIDRGKLLAMATKIGVGDSTRFLNKHKGTFARLAAPGGFTGERFLEQCAPVLARPEALVTGLHVYTFNQVAETEAWRRDYLDRLMAVR
jgi:methylenetetrahydrofolate reductase (NADPH)